MICLLFILFDYSYVSPEIVNLVRVFFVIKRIVGKSPKGMTSHEDFVY